MTTTETIQKINDPDLIVPSHAPGTWRVASPSDAFAIELCTDAGGAQLSPQTLQEVIEASPLGQTYEDAHGRILAICGLIETTYQVHPWLVFSSLVDEYMDFAPDDAGLLAAALRGYAGKGRLVCDYIGKRDTKGRSFIEHLGFRIVPAPSGDFDFFYLPNHV